MNTFIQDPETFLVGDKNAAEALKTKAEAKLLVVSDSHGAVDILYNIILSQGKDCDALIFCGDGISDLIQIIQLAGKNENLAHSIPPVIAFVCGNNDTTSYALNNPRFDQDNPASPFYVDLSVPYMLSFKICTKTIFMTHGHLYNLYGGTRKIVDVATEHQSSVAFYGHSHFASAQNENGIYLVNPGSCSLPRGGQNKSFAIVTIKSQTADIDVVFYETNGVDCTPYIPAPRPF